MHDLDPDLDRSELNLTDRVRALREAHLRAIPEVCAERATLITRYHLAPEAPGARSRRAGTSLLDQDHRDRISPLEKARAYRYVLENREPIVWHRWGRDKNGRRFPVTAVPLFAGSTTSKFVGVPVYPELLGLALWPELDSVGTRKANPYYLSPRDYRALNREVFPAWMDHTLMELARAREDPPTTPHGALPSDYDLYQQLLFFIISRPECVSHTIPLLKPAVDRGLRDLRDEALELTDSAPDPERRDFYLAAAEALEGIIHYSRNLALEAQRLARHDPKHRAELEALARLHGRVPELPAETFREGLTTIWICWIALHLENVNAALSLGRLDQILYPLYQREREAGTLTPEQALEYLCSLWLKLADHVIMVPEAGEELFGGTGSNQAVTIGGTDEQGNDAVNELSYLILKATELMRLRDPNLNARYLGTPHASPSQDRFLRALCRTIVTTEARPAIHNDAAVTRALRAKGDSEEQARDYGVIGCVEPGSSGRHYGHCGAIVLDLPAVLELALFDGRRLCGDRWEQVTPPTGEDFATYAAFELAFEAQLRYLVEAAVRLDNGLWRVHRDFYPTPILSTFFEGPLPSRTGLPGTGRDVTDRGATLSSSGVTIIGFADVVDSLVAVQRVVFDNHEMTFRELRTVLGNDFRGQEQVRERLAKLADTAGPLKFGNDRECVQQVANALALRLDTVFSAFSGDEYPAGPYRVGYWSMTSHVGLGRMVCALPNGRQAGKSFASGMTPVSHVAPLLTAALNSVAAIPNECVTSGMALNLKLPPPTSPSAREKSVDRLVELVKGYFTPRGEKANCGMEIQFNVVTREQLEKLKQHPHDMPPFLVRVSGYTAYFQDLNDGMKAEVIDRALYSLDTGQEIPPPPRSETP